MSPRYTLFTLFTLTLYSLYSIHAQRAEYLCPLALRAEYEEGRVPTWFSRSKSGVPISLSCSEKEFLYGSESGVPISLSRSKSGVRREQSTDLLHLECHYFFKFESVS